MTERVYTLFQQSVAAKMQVGEALGPAIDQAAEYIIQAFLQDKKLLVCGNGSSLALSQLFTSYLIERFEKERPSLPAICLGNTVNSNDDEAYAKAARALTQNGDVLVTICDDGNARNLIQASHVATSRGAQVIALTGRDGGQLGAYISDHQGIEIRANVDTYSHIHEIHLLIIHCLCDLIDHRLFGID